MLLTKDGALFLCHVVWAILPILCSLLFNKNYVVHYSLVIWYNMIARRIPSSYSYHEKAKSSFNVFYINIYSKLIYYLGNVRDIKQFDGNNCKIGRVKSQIFEPRCSLLEAAPQCAKPPTHQALNM